MLTRTNEKKHTHVLIPKLMGVRRQICIGLHVKTKQNKGDVFAYDVIAAILNNLHILKNTQGFTSGTRRIWNQHLDIDKKPSNKFVYVKKQGRCVCL